MNDSYMEAQEAIHSDEREADKERELERTEGHDVHEPTTFERANEEYDNYFWDEKHAL